MHPPVEQILTDDYLHDIYLFDTDGETPLTITGQTFSLVWLDRHGGTIQANPAGTLVNVQDGPNGHVRIFIPTADVQTMGGADDEVVFRLRWDTIGTTIQEWTVRFRP